MVKLTGSVVIITGATSGMGKATHCYSQMKARMSNHSPRANAPRQTFYFNRWFA